MISKLVLWMVKKIVSSILICLLLDSILCLRLSRELIRIEDAKCFAIHDWGFSFFADQRKSGMAWLKPLLKPIYFKNNDLTHKFCTILSRIWITCGAESCIFCVSDSGFGLFFKKWLFLIFLQYPKKFDLPK